jgi:hypothetical protein
MKVHPDNAQKPQLFNTIDTHFAGTLTNIGYLSEVQSKSVEIVSGGEYPSY